MSFDYNLIFKPLLFSSFYCILLFANHNKYFNTINLIPNECFYFIISIEILTLTGMLIISRSYFNKCKTDIHSIINNISKLYYSYIIYNDFNIIDNGMRDMILQNNSLVITDESDNESIFSKDSEIDDTLQDDILEYTDQFNKDDIFYIKELLCLYMTYIIEICKFYNNNHDYETGLNYMDYSRFEKFISTEIERLRICGPISPYQFKLKYLENLIKNSLYTNKNYNNDLYIDNIANSSETLLINLKYKIYPGIYILYKIIHHIFILFILFKDSSELGILYTYLIVLFITYIENQIKTLLNPFTDNKIINIDFILSNLYNELYIIYNFVTNKTCFNL